LKILGLIPLILAPMFVGSLAVSACYLDNPGASPAADAGPGADAAPGGPLVGDGAAPSIDGRDGGDAAAPGDAGPPLCTKYGGFSTVQVVVNDFVGALVADCRISRFFTTLTAERVGHLHDCLVKQVAVVMRCPGIKYDIDNAGVECRDMKTAHKGISIRQADFDALIQDLVTVLTRDGVAQADIDAIAPSVLALRDDIVTNSAPDTSRSICDAGNEQ
jgi:hypothetical protein